MTKVKNESTRRAETLSVRVLLGVILAIILSGIVSYKLSPDWGGFVVLLTMVLGVAIWTPFQRRAQHQQETDGNYALLEEEAEVASRESLGK